MIDPIPLITVLPVEPIDPHFAFNCTDAEWDAEMRARYGNDWETMDD